jgi:DDE superfamily endonuclease
VAATLSVLPSAPGAYPDPPALARLQAFRAGLHACCTRRADALVDLADALLSVPGPLWSLPQLSLEPAHRRGWGSTYAALASGRIDAERLRELLAGCLQAADPLVFAVDVTTWPRCDAECSPERGYYYHPSRHSAGQPIIAGWAFQWVAQVSFARDSWTAPGGRGQAAPGRRHRPASGPPGPCAAWTAAFKRAGAMVRVRRRLRLRPTHPRPGRRWRGGAGAAAVGPLLVRRPATTPARLKRLAAPPRRQVQLRRPGHLARPDHHLGHQR